MKQKGDIFEPAEMEVEWTVEIGGREIKGAVHVSQEASDAEIEDAVRADISTYTSWQKKERSITATNYRITISIYFAPHCDPIVETIEGENLLELEGRISPVISETCRYHEKQGEMEVEKILEVDGQWFGGDEYSISVNKEYEVSIVD